MKKQCTTGQQSINLREFPQFRLFFKLNLWLIAISGIWLILSELSLPSVPSTGFDGLLRLQDKPAAAATIILMIFAWYLMPWWSEAKLKRLLQLVSQHISAIVAMSFVVYALLAYFVYLRFPLSMDEYCLSFQSKVFASGNLAGRVPPDLVDYYIFRPFQAGFFTVNHQQGWVLSSYWPGTSLLMTPFSYLGVTWLYNPVISALTLLVLHLVVKRWSGSEEAAAWAVLLTLASPVIAICAASFYSMPSHLLANLLFCGLLIQDNRKAALGAGLIGGFAMTLHNPVPHFAFALPWMLYVLRYRHRRQLLVPLICGYCIFGVTLGIGWVACLSWFSVAENGKIAQESNGILAAIPKVFSLPDATIIANRISGMVKLLLWASPGLLIVFLWTWRTQLESRLRVLRFSFVSTLLVYMAVSFDQGQGWGFRYLHSAWLALPILAAFVLGNEKTHMQQTAVEDKNALARFVSLCAVLSVLMLIPLFSITTRDYIVRRITQLPESPQDRRSILFINPMHGEYSYDLAHNDPFLRNKNWLLIGRDASSNATIARKYLTNAKQISSGKWGELWGEESSR